MCSLLVSWAQRPFTKHDTFRKAIEGVEPTLVSPAAKFVIQRPSERSCRGQNGRRGSRGSRFNGVKACCQRGRAKTFCEDGNVAMLDSSRLMAGLTLSENTCFPTGCQGLLELPI